MVLGVVCALYSEARHLGRPLGAGPHVEAMADGKLLALTGMGCAAAHAGALTLIECGAQALASFGLAGALDPRLPPGTIMVAAEVASEEGAALATDELWRTRMLGALGAQQRSSGRLLSTAHPVSSARAKASLFAASGACAVDMESFGVARAARRARLPFLAVRVIIDGAADALPHAVLAAIGPDGHTSTAALLQQLARRPGDLAPLLRLARGYRRASRSLAAVARLDAFLPRALAVPP
jgi:adenosylhomocysteine nucleosidase